MSGSSSLVAALAVYVAYLAVVAVVWRVNRVRYDALAESRRNVVRGIVVPIGLGSLLLAAATTWLGWWQTALFQERVGPAWAVVVPGLFGAVAVVAVSGIDWRSPQARAVLPMLAVGVLLVGFAEELLCRGLLVVGGREAGWGPWAVFLLSTGLFALLHGLNAFYGQSVAATVVQIGASFLAGAALYVTRLSTGSLLVAMLLHALWDFGSLGIAATGGRARTAAPFALLACWGVAVVAVPFVLAS